MRLGSFASGKVFKHEMPKGDHLYHPDVHRVSNLSSGNPQTPLWVTEGTPKGDALVSQGVCAIALNGVWGFRGTNAHGGKVVLPDWKMSP